LDIHSLQPGLSPIDIISLARPSLGVLGRITEEVRCLGNRIEALSFPHSFRDVSQDLKLWVYLARETMSGALDCERYAGVLGIDVAQSRALLQLPPRAAA
jgi:hypothetical protein